MTVSCPCPGGVSGAQTCQASGAFGECVCGGADAGGSDAARDASADAPSNAVDAMDAQSLDAMSDVVRDGMPAATDSSMGSIADSGDPVLAMTYSSETFRVLYQATCSGSACDSMIRTHPGGIETCGYDGSSVTFRVPACTAMESGISACSQILSGTIPLDGSGGPTMSLAVGAAVVGASRTIVQAGLPYFSGPTRLQNFHVQFFVPLSGAGVGATGVSGMTADPFLGDLWLLGCGGP